MNIDLYLALYEEKSILRNLMELAQYDYSKYDGYDVEESGLYGYKYLDHYWTDSERFPYIVRVEGKLAGFALVRICDKTSAGSNIYSIAEFCILHKYRGKGIGKEVARRIFSNFPGEWSIQTCSNNEIARQFWQSVTAKYDRSEFSASQKDEFMVIMQFDSQRINKGRI